MAYTYDTLIPRNQPKAKPATPITANGENPTAAARQTMQKLYGSVQPQSVVQPNSQMGVLNQQQDQYEQQAYVDFQRFMNYLKLGQAAQGQTVSAGDKIKAQANYQTQLGDINTKYAGLKAAAAEEERTKAETKAEKDRLAAEAAADEETARIANEQNAWVSLIQNRIETVMGDFDVDETTGEYTQEDWQKLWALYESGKGKLSKSQQEMMEYYLNTLPHKAESTEQDNNGSPSGSKEQSPVKQVTKDFWEELANAIGRGNFGQ